MSTNNIIDPDYLASRTEAWEWENLRDYEAILEKLGLSGEEAESVIEQRKLLLQDAIITGESSTKLQKERIAYKKHLKDTLGEEGYAQYKTFELSRVSSKELGKINCELERFGETIPSEQTDLVVQLLNRTGAITSHSWDGPFDPLPSPQVGMEAMLKYRKEKLDTLITNVSQFDTVGNEIGLPKNTISLLTLRYDSVISHWENKVAALSSGDPNAFRLLLPKIPEAHQTN